ncbi:MAG TPA: hypothetical protein VGX78_05755 [Pirellulales bacterium]|nr:hypothetical protein [Pirellulales bacterium]
MPIQVHGLIAKGFSKEYVEAVVTDALAILPSYTHRSNTLVVINARRVAVILDHRVHRGTVASGSREGQQGAYALRSPYQTSGRLTRINERVSRLSSQA